MNIINKIIDIRIDPLIYLLRINPIPIINSIQGIIKATKLFMTHGIITALAQIGRYESISLGSVVIVHPITLSVNPIVTIILASIFLNKIEKINAKVWIAGLLVIIGIQMAT